MGGPLCQVPGGQDASAPGMRGCGEQACHYWGATISSNRPRYGSPLPAHGEPSLPACPARETPPLVPSLCLLLLPPCRVLYCLRARLSPVPPPSRLPSLPQPIAVHSIHSPSPASVTCSLPDDCLPARWASKSGPRMLAGRGAEGMQRVQMFWALSQICRFQKERGGWLRRARLAELR